MGQSEAHHAYNIRFKKILMVAHGYWVATRQVWREKGEQQTQAL